MDNFQGGGVALFGWRGLDESLVREARLKPGSSGDMPTASRMKANRLTRPEDAATPGRESVLTRLAGMVHCRQKANVCQDFEG